ncbi:TRAP transporter small permease [Georgenia sp. MJ170]|uniref:TRAP transporter small permease n=1 Tax=Georgenia sunbinii TaxID=3117728 RepID=UPI002F26747B
MSEIEAPDERPHRRPVGTYLALAMDRFGQVVGALCVALILVLVSVQVVQRVTTGGSWAWSGEIAKFAMVWSTFILAPHLLRVGGHLRVDVIEQWLTPRGERWMTRLTDILIAATCAGLTWAGWGLLNAPFLGSAPASGIPLTVIYAVPVLGLLFTTIMAIGKAIFGQGSAFDVEGIAPAPEAVL